MSEEWQQKQASVKFDWYSLKLTGEDFLLEPED
jgi:hypothetical protein